MTTGQMTTGQMTAGQMTAGPRHMAGTWLAHIRQIAGIIANSVRKSDAGLLQSAGAM
jgi:hypothetical protein